jgi:hypothetical protein
MASLIEPTRKTRLELTRGKFSLGPENTKLLWTRRKRFRIFRSTVLEFPGTASDSYDRVRCVVDRDGSVGLGGGPRWKLPHSWQVQTRATKTHLAILLGLLLSKNLRLRNCVFAVLGDSRLSYALLLQGRARPVLCRHASFGFSILAVNVSARPSTSLWNLCCLWWTIPWHPTLPARDRWGFVGSFTHVILDSIWPPGRK